MTEQQARKQIDELETQRALTVVERRGVARQGRENVFNLGMSGCVFDEFVEAVRIAQLILALDMRINYADREIGKREAFLMEKEQERKERETVGG